MGPEVPWATIMRQHIPPISSDEFEKLPPFLTKMQAAGILQLSLKTIGRYLASGKLPRVPELGSVRIPKVAVQRMKEAKSCLGADDLDKHIQSETE